MGIPAYFSHVVRHHKQVLRPLSKRQRAGKVDTLYIDANSTVYDAVRKVSASGIEPTGTAFEDAVIEAVVRRLNYYIKTVRPTRGCLVAFDGVVPMAKAGQARQRRFRAVVEKALSDGESAAPSWNTAAITPGTAFMEKLGKRVGRGVRGQGRCKVRCSDTSVAGEGEQKIFAEMRASRAKRDCVVYGLDADLIMLSLLHLPYCKSLSLIREAPSFGAAAPKRGAEDELLALDVAALAEVACDGRPEEYVAKALLFGNDFIPHVPSVSLRLDGLDVVDAAYEAVRAAGESLVQHRRLNWRGWTAMIEALGESEESDMVANEKRRREQLGKGMHLRKREGESLQAATVESVPLFSRNDELFVECPLEGWRSRYSERIMGGISEAASCDEYLQALQWTWDYYTGRPVSWTWCYPYDSGPLCSSVAARMRDGIPSPPAGESGAAVDPIAYLGYVLPPASRDLLPPRVAGELDKLCSAGVVDIKWAYCRFLWEAHAVIEAPSMDDVVGIVERHRACETA